MEDHAGRMDAFRRRLERLHADAYWLVNADNVRYLCGFRGEDSTLLLTAGRAVLITDSRYVEQAEREAQVDEVVSRHTPMVQAVGSLCRALAVRRLAVTGANLTHAQFLALAEAAPALNLTVRREGLAEAMRRRKDAGEVALIRAAIGTAEAAFLAVARDMKSGWTEGATVARLEYEMRLRGADGAAFETTCAAGANASVPHALAGETEIGAGEGLLMDWGARRDGYCCDLTRMICLDRIPARLEALVEIVLEAQTAAFDRLKPGTTCGEADAAGRSVIARAGYGNCFGHGIGHGVGLAVHEGPGLAPRSETVLLPGMVVTVEPGIYLPGEAGVRIEDMALVTADGHEVLTTLPRRPGDVQALVRGSAAESAGS